MCLPKVVNVFNSHRRFAGRRFFKRLPGNRSEYIVRESDYGHLTSVPVMFPDNTIDDCCGEGTVPLATMKALKV